MHNFSMLKLLIAYRFVLFMFLLTFDLLVYLNTFYISFACLRFSLLCLCADSISLGKNLKIKILIEGFVKVVCIFRSL